MRRSLYKLHALLEESELELSSHCNSTGAMRESAAESYAAGERSRNTSQGLFNYALIAAAFAECETTT